MNFLTLLLVCILTLMVNGNHLALPCWSPDSCNINFKLISVEFPMDCRLTYRSGGRSTNVDVNAMELKTSKDITSYQYCCDKIDSRQTLIDMTINANDPVTVTLNDFINETHPLTVVTDEDGKIKISVTVVNYANLIQVTALTGDNQTQWFCPMRIMMIGKEWCDKQIDSGGLFHYRIVTTLKAAVTLTYGMNSVDGSNTGSVGENFAQFDLTKIRDLRPSEIDEARYRDVWRYEGTTEVKDVDYLPNLKDSLERSNIGSIGEKGAQPAFQSASLPANEGWGIDEPPTADLALSV